MGCLNPVCKEYVNHDLPAARLFRDVLTKIAKAILIAIPAATRMPSARPAWLTP